MSWDKGIGLTVAFAGLVVAGTYGPFYTKSKQNPNEVLERSSAVLISLDVQAAEPSVQVQSPALHPPIELGDAERASVRHALSQAVDRARREAQAVEESDSAPAPAPIDAGGLPDMEMTWEQYRSWTKFAAALADRDYKKSDGMLPAMKALFGDTVASVMVDAYVEDYRAFLIHVVESRCGDFEPQSVWRKTLFMSFALARLNRSSASLEGRANEARALCGYDG